MAQFLKLSAINNVAVSILCAAFGPDAFGAILTAYAVGGLVALIYWHRK